MVVTRAQAHQWFCAELQNFLTATAPSGSIVTAREIKLWVRALPADHPVKASYNRYVELCGHERDRVWSLEDFNRIANHMKYLPGYQKQYAYTKRYETGAQTRFIKVYKNVVKI